MLLTLMAQNVARGALYNSAGEYKDRWPRFVERINKVKPDILLLSELNGWTTNGHKQLVRAANDLDMDTVPISPSNTGYATGLLYNRQKLGRWQRYYDKLAYETTHGFSVTGFDIGLPHLLHVTTVHLCYYSAQKAAVEAQLVLSKTSQYSPLGIIGGDMNYSPAEGPEPDWTLAKPYNLPSRTIIDSTSSSDLKKLRTNRQVGLTLKRGGFVDAAAHLYRQTKDDELLEPTASNERIDQFWLSAPLAPAIESYELTRLHPEASDHAGVVIKIDTEKIDKSQMWKGDEL